MKCPSCNVDLVMSERQGVEIDYCPQCRGVWLDRGELDKIIDKSMDKSSQSVRKISIMTEIKEIIKEMMTVMSHGIPGENVTHFLATCLISKN